MSNVVESEIVAEKLQRARWLAEQLRLELAYTGLYIDLGAEVRDSSRTTVELISMDVVQTAELLAYIRAALKMPLPYVVYVGFKGPAEEEQEQKGLAARIVEKIKKVVRGR